MILYERLIRLNRDAKEDITPVRVKVIQLITIKYRNKIIFLYVLKSVEHATPYSLLIAIFKGSSMWELGMLTQLSNHNRVSVSDGKPFLNTETKSMLNHLVSVVLRTSVLFQVEIQYCFDNSISSGLRYRMV